MERKRISIKLEIYEDEKEEFLGLIYLLKYGLKDKRWYTLLKRSRLNSDEDENMSDEEFIEKKISEDEKSYLNFLKYFTDKIYVSSVDGNKPIGNWYISGSYNVLPEEGQKSIPAYMERVKNEEEDKLFYELFRNKKTSGAIEVLSLDEDIIDFDKKLARWKVLKGNEELIENKDKKRIYEDIDSFFEGPKIIKSRLSEYKYKELINWVLVTGLSKKPNVIKTDEYFENSLKLDSGILEILPPTLYRGWFAEKNLFSRKVDSNFAFGGWSKDDSYFLITDIYDTLKFYFPKLAQPNSKDYQLRIITGYTGSIIGIFDDEDTYLENKSGSKRWRNYLADNVLNYLKKCGRFTAQKMD